MRALATGLLTFLILIQSSMPHAQGWNSAVTPLNPGKHRHGCPGAGYYDNVRTCCCVNNFTGIAFAPKWRPKLQLGLPQFYSVFIAAQRSALARTLIVLVSFSLAGCSTGGAPSFDLFGAFFPAWLLCGIVGIAGAAVARVAFVRSGLANTLPYQLAVCTAIGVITAVLVWLIGFGH